MEKLDKVSHVLHLRLSNRETEETVLRLESAVFEHTRWINNLSRSIICNTPIDKSYLSEETYKNCRFGRWYNNQTSDVLNKYPGFVMIDQFHRTMHEKASKLALKVSKRENILTQEYDDFIEVEQQLTLSILKLRDEFYKLLYAFDPLTGLLTRQAFFLILAQEYARAMRNNEPCSLSMVDLDHFKLVNDTYGHQTGDLVLELTSRYFLDQLRPYDSICRYGGEEFLICLPKTNENTAKKILDRLRDGLSKMPITVNPSKDIQITASFGIAKFSDKADILRTIAQADETLYRAKREGRNMVCIYGE